MDEIGFYASSFIIQNYKFIEVFLGFIMRESHCKNGRNYKLVNCELKSILTIHAINGLLPPSAYSLELIHFIQCIKTPKRVIRTSCY